MNSEVGEMEVGVVLLQALEDAQLAADGGSSSGEDEPLLRSADEVRFALIVNSQCSACQPHYACCAAPAAQQIVGRVVVTGCQSSWPCQCAGVSA